MKTRFRTPTPTRGGAPSHSPPDVHYLPGLRLSHALAWFSVCLGVLKIVAPRQVGRVTGVGPGLLRTYGFRELACGLGIFASARPTPWIWMRVAGDLLDLAALADPKVPRQSRSLAASLAVAGVTALDVGNGLQLSAAERLEDRAIGQEKP